MTPLEAAYVEAAARGDAPTADRLAADIDAEQAAREARLNAPGALRDAALWYASNGHAVFPCIPSGKRPATAHGFQDATTDPDVITAWWSATPDANIGLPTGTTFDVFDMDGPAGLIAVHAYLDAGQFPATLARAFTPRGRHYYVPATGAGNRTHLLEQVDYRGAGGYVVAPPSRTPLGTYRWLDDEHLRPADARTGAPA